MHNLFYKRKRKLPKLLFLIILPSAIIIGIKALDHTGGKASPSPTTAYQKEADKAYDHEAFSPGSEVINEGIMKTECVYSCGHSECREEKIPEKYIGLTTSQVLESNPEIINCYYDGEILNIQIQNEKKCSRHYMVRLEDDRFVIYNENDPESTREEIKVDLRGLYEDEIESLKKGIEFSSREEILEFLEDFAS